ncbi:MAG: ABC transporter permease, partial [Candidatus Solibacter usitatus]|nr:ABC transporter permease [Candidatus Solibacter usitatus]
MHDLRYALRSLSRSPVLSSVAVLSLALGIGANTAIFSLLDQVLLRLLPVPNPGELVNLRSPGAKPGHTYSDGDDASSFSYPMYKDLRDRQPVFTGLLARLAVPLSVAAQGQTERASGELVTGNYFQVLGVRAALGRTFTQEDDRLPGAHPLAVLSHGYWTRRFGADASVLNQPIVVNGRSLTVVGVARAGFSGVQVGQTPDVFIPMTMKAQMTPSWDGIEDRKDYWLNIIGRLKPGVPRERAAAAMQTLYAPLLEMEAERSNFRGQSRERFLARKILLEPGGQGRQILQSEARDPLALLMAMVGLVLLIACANVANLLIARAAVRQKELAVRLSLGAGRGRLIRQLLLESVVLGLAGGLAGLLVASWTADSMVRLLLSGSDIRGLSADLDPRVLGFNFALAALTGLVFGLAPALRATRPNLSPVLKNQAAGVSTDSAHARFRKVLVTGQMAFTVLLLAAAGLFVESLYNLKNLD